MIVLGVYYTVHREPGWGQQKDAFPLLVLTRRADGKHDVNIVGQGELKQLAATKPDFTFTVRSAELKDVDRQLDALRDGDAETPDSNKFHRLSLEVRDLSDGSQQIHLNASRYDDGVNESWYIARDKTFDPLYHRQHIDIGVGIAAVFGSVISTVVISPVVGGAIVLLLSRRRRRQAIRS